MKGGSVLRNVEIRKLTRFSVKQSDTRSTDGRKGGGETSDIVLSSRIIASIGITHTLDEQAIYDSK